MDDEIDSILDDKNFEDELDFQNYMDWISALPMIDRLEEALAADLENECGREIEQEDIDVDEWVKTILGNDWLLQNHIPILPSSQA